MTLDVYAHVLPAMDRAAADAIGALVRSTNEQAQRAIDQVRDGA
jgi:hypothetical protein